MTATRPRRRDTGIVSTMLAALALVALALPAGSRAQEPRRTAFKVCQDPANLPFSDAQGNGFENRIARLLADSLGLPVEYYNFPQRLGFIRNTLRFRLPGEAYACDVIMGVPAQSDQVASTRPYYRSSYALVLGSRLSHVTSVSAFLSLPASTRDGLRIGVYDRSPASDWLVRHELLAQARPYPMLNADPGHYSGQILDRDLARGDLDAAVVWGPIAGYFSRRVTAANLRVLPLASEPGLPLEFDIAIGVRQGEAEWQDTLDGLLSTHRREIHAILEEYGVPLLPVDEETRR